MTLFVAGYIAPTLKQAENWAVRKTPLPVTLRQATGRSLYQLAEAQRCYTRALATIEPLGSSYRVTVRAA